MGQAELLRVSCSDSAQEGFEVSRGEAFGAGQAGSPGEAEE